MTEQNNIYRGIRADGKVKVTKNGEPLSMHLHIQNHSPTGFNFGYGGSGPSQLALAIMVEEYGSDLNHHPVYYIYFKNDFIANISGDSFEITSKQIAEYVESQNQGMRHG